MENEDQNFVFFKKLFIFTEVLGLVCVLLVALWILVCRGGFAGGSDPLHAVYWHPFLTTLGLVFLYANGILMYRGFRSERKKKLKIMHTWIFVLAFVLTVFGTVAIFNYQTVLEINNMYSLHSWMGLIVIILFAMQWVAGFLIFLFPVLRTSVRAAYLPVHQAFGLLIFMGAVSTSLVGFTEKAIYVLNGTTPENPSYTSFPAEGILINFIGLLLLIFACLVMYLTANPRYRRQISEEQPLISPDSRHQSSEEPLVSSFHHQISEEQPLLSPNSFLQTTEEPPLASNFYCHISGHDTFITPDSTNQTTEPSFLTPSFQHHVAEEEVVTTNGIHSPSSEDEALLEHMLSV